MSLEVDWLAKWNQYAPTSVALKDGDSGQQFSYSEFYWASLLGAEVLRHQGLKKGDRIAILSTNELEYIVLFYACQRIGAILVPINFRLTKPEAEHIINDCDPRLIVYQSTYEEIVSHFKDRQRMLLTEFEKKRSSLASSDPLSKDFEGGFEDPVMIIYTSGTTGAPKGALLTHKMIFWNSVNTTLRLNINQSDCAVIFLPFFHTGGWNVLTTPFLHRGAKLVFLKKFEAERILQVCEKDAVTVLFGVPTTMDMMARTSEFKTVNLKSVRYAIVGGEPMPIELIKTWHEKGIPVRQGYGLTEFGPNVFSLNEQDAIRKIGSIGFPNFYCETFIANDHGKECGVDEVGELWLKGPMAMPGYWQNPKATAETFSGDWLKTGDLVRRDKEGYVYVVGRKKDMYKSGGENVYPAEVEKTIRSLSGIREIAVVGVPDPKWGEVGKAFVVFEADSQWTESSLTEECLKHLAKFKVPKYFKVLSELPKGDSGKILKRKLLEMYP
jgi:fatty-acyl-CoA synthase